MKILHVNLFFYIVMTSFSFAETLNVPLEKFPSIQAGIDSAAAGDTVLVAENIYYENINFKGKAITVASQFILDNDSSHISRTIIDGSLPSHPDSGSVVSFISGEDTSTVLTGFTITGGSGTENFLLDAYSRDGGGILILNAGATIRNNKIIHNSISTGSNFRSGAGVSAGGDLNNYIIIHGNEISENMLNGKHTWGAGAMLFTKGTIDFNNNIVKGNIATSSGGYTSRGGGIVIDGAFGYTGQVFVRNNMFISNQSIHETENSNGGGMFIHNAKLQICRNVFLGNISAGGGGAIYARHDPSTSGTTNAKIMNNVICYNESNSGAGIVVSGTQARAEVLNSIVWNNSGSEIQERIGGQITISYSDIEGGWLDKGNINENPMFIDSLYHLHEDSPCIDTGHPGIEYIDMDGTRNDMGAYGGSYYCVTSIEKLDQDIAELHNYILSQNYPNPFNLSTAIEFNLPQSAFITFKIYSVAGHEVSKTVSDHLPAGTHKYTWDASGYASGVYYYQIITESFTDTKKMILIR